MKMNRARLKEIIRSVMSEEKDYEKYFRKELEKAGFSSPAEMSDDEKREFFNKIDSGWKGKNEELTGDQHKLDVDGDGDIGSDDLAALRAGKKPVKEEKSKYYIEIDSPREIDSNRVKSEIKSLMKRGARAADIGLRMNFLTTDPKDMMNKFQKVKNHVYFANDPRRFESVKVEGLSVDVAKHMDKIYKGFVKVEGDGTMIYDSPATAKKAADILNKNKISASTDGKYLYIESKISEGKYDLFFGHLGNGITVANRLVDDPRTRDYKKVAHIGDDGKITWYDKRAEKDTNVRNQIQKVAKKNESVNEEVFSIALGVAGGIMLQKAIAKAAEFVINKAKVAQPKVTKWMNDNKPRTKEELLAMADNTSKFASYSPGKKLIHNAVVELKKLINSGKVKSVKSYYTEYERLLDIEYKNNPNESVNEGNAFGMAVTQAKKEGKTEFEFNGKTYKVKKGLTEKNKGK